MVLSSIVPLLAAAVRLACGAGIVIVVATVVRRHRPDAWQPLLVWAILSLVAPKRFKASA
ncbi:MAG: hypothetical protein IPK80_11270 [Nannocystis sp.]|nr:hypothetical protein [Nannocystis sp.]